MNALNVWDLINLYEGMMINRDHKLMEVRLRGQVESSQRCLLDLHKVFLQSRPEQTSKLQMKSDDLLMKGGAAPA